MSVRKWETFQRLSYLKRFESSVLSQEDEATWRTLRLQIEASICHQPLFTQQPDRRRYLRVPCSLGMRYQTGGVADSRTMINLSEGGCFVMTRKPLDPGAEMVMEIFAPEHACRNIKARVVWIETAATALNLGMGISFLEVTPEQHAALEGLIDKLVRIRMGFMAPMAPRRVS